jgi:hypothetical protein
MKMFDVWIRPIDGDAGLRVTGPENAKWLLRRLSEYFVFKTSEPVIDIPHSSDCTFRVVHGSRLSGPAFAKLLAGIAEVKLMLEPAQSASSAV